MSDPAQVPDLRPDFGASTEQDPMMGRVLDNRYRLLSLIAVGGMGRVYKAEQVGLSRLVAVKILAVDESIGVHDPNFKERFHLEAATAGRLTSPNTVTIFDYGHTDDDVWYIVMEYVEGITLSRLLKHEKTLLPARALSIARQVCLSLREAHAHDVVHRDIKPGNIFISNQGYELVKVLDFGIAKLLPGANRPDRDLTRIGAYVGTPEYMAPECFRGEIDHRADIYSVGVVLYYMLSGRLPFKGSNPTRTILALHYDPVPPFDPALGIPPALKALVFTCLEKDPERRFQTIDDVLRAMEPLLIELGADVATPTQTQTFSRAPVLSAAGRSLAAGAFGGRASSRQIALAAVLVVIVVSLGVLLWMRRPVPVAEQLPRAASGSSIVPAADGSLIPPSMGAGEGRDSARNMDRHGGQASAVRPLREESALEAFPRRSSSDARRDVSHPSTTQSTREGADDEGRADGRVGDVSSSKADPSARSDVPPAHAAKAASSPDSSREEGTAGAAAHDGSLDSSPSRSSGSPLEASSGAADVGAAQPTGRTGGVLGGRGENEASSARRAEKADTRDAVDSASSDASRASTGASSLDEDVPPSPGETIPAGYKPSPY